MSNSNVLQEELLQQQILQHYVRTKYFNDLWLSLMTKLAVLVGFMAFVALRLIAISSDGLFIFASLFEGFTLLITVTTVYYINRYKNPLMAFKIAFTCSLLQMFWYLYTLYCIFTQQPRRIGDLTNDQFPGGAMYFIVCWIADRYMVRAITTAKKNADEINNVIAIKKSQ